MHTLMAIGHLMHSYSYVRSSCSVSGLLRRTGWLHSNTSKLRHEMDCSNTHSRLRFTLLRRHTRPAPLCMPLTSAPATHTTGSPANSARPRHLRQLGREATPTQTGLHTTRRLPSVQQ